MRISLLTLFALYSLAAGAAAQTETLLSGDVENGFLFSPDFKFTDVNGDFANLAGGYGGWVIDKKFLVGGGVYTLTNGGSNDMTYGGGVLEYFVNQGSLVNVSVRGLVGGGSATLSAGAPRFDFDGLDFGFDSDFFRGPGNISGLVRDVVGRFGIGDRFGRIDGAFLGRDFSTSSSFFIAEPEVNVILNLSERFRFSVGGGYRFIGGAGRLNDRLDGFAANVGLKVSFF